MNPPQNTLPTIAILMAAYNGTPWLVAQIDSIVAQVDVNIQLFISVDASSDGTEFMVDSLAQQDARIHVLKHGEHFGSAGKNFYRLLIEVDFSSFEYIALADQDDIWLPTKLLQACQMLRNYGVDAYSSNAIAFWPDGSQRMIHKAQAQVAWDYMFESAGPGCTFTLTKRLALDIQTFLNQHQAQCSYIDLHDWFIYAFARSHGYRWHIDSNAYIHYRQHPYNLVGANVGLKAVLFRVKKMRAGWLFKQAILIADALAYGDQEPISRLKRHHLMDRLHLILHVHQLRRRWRDRFALAFFMLIFSSQN